MAMQRSVSVVVDRSVGDEETPGHCKVAITPPSPHAAGAAVTAAASAAVPSPLPRKFRRILLVRHGLSMVFLCRSLRGSD